MEPPGFSKEQTAVGVDRGVIAEHMVKRRNIRAIGVTSLHWLLKLTRIAQQDNALGCLRYSQDVRQRDLGCFVDKEYVDCLGSIRPGP